MNQGSPQPAEPLEHLLALSVVSVTLRHVLAGQVDLGAVFRAVRLVEWLADDLAGDEGEQ